MSARSLVAVRTVPFSSSIGSAADPLADEVTWQAWELVAADPTRLSPEVVQSITISFDLLVEAAWQPGRSLVISECEWVPANSAIDDGRLAVRLAVGVLGPRGATAAEVRGLTSRVEAALGRHHVLAARAIDPAEVISSCAVPDLGPGRLRAGAGHMAHIRQHTIAVGDDDDLVEVPSRFAPTIEPWAAVVRQLVDLDQHVRVRATVLATELSPLDRMEIERGLARIRAIRLRNPDRADVAFDADRAEATLLDLRASLSSPILAGEIALWSAEPLPHTARRSIAASFTSESDVLRRQGHVVVATNRLLLGGFEIVDDPPGWAEAFHLGLPLRGGLRERAMVDLLTLTESPIGWPLPFGGPLPSIGAQVPIVRPVPAVYRAVDAGSSSVLGASPGGHEVHLAVARRTRHRLVTGTWGAGKTTAMLAQALEDLTAGRPFLWIDPHGVAADQLIATAHSLGVDAVVVDANDGATDLVQILPSAQRSDRELLDHAARRVSEAFASSLPNVEWTGPRWFTTFAALLEVVAQHRGELIDGAVWLNDPSALRKLLDDPAISSFARSTLRNLLVGQGDGADVRGWASSKLHPVVSGTARRVIAPAGQGIDVGAAILEGRPVIVNLSALTSSEGNFIGHLILSTVLDAAFERLPDGPEDVITCYLDEAHRFPASGLARAFAEGRKFGIGLDIAVQGLGQLPGELADLALGAGTQVVFRATPDTASRLSPLLQVPVADLISQPDLHATVAIQGHPATTVVVDPVTPPPVERSETLEPLRPLPRPISEGDTAQDRARPVQRRRPGPAAASPGPLGDLLAELRARRNGSTDAAAPTNDLDEDGARAAV